MAPPLNKKRRTLRRILITAGPTREMLDPVRFITNLSTGEMGFAIAREAKRQGFRVTLISGPTCLVAPPGIRQIPISTVADLDRALQKEFPRNDALIMSAAVGDFIPLRRALKKIPRQKHWTVSFRQSPDLVKKLAVKKGNRVVIGFSLETGNWIRRSEEKRRRKQLDGIVANYYSPLHNPFGRGEVHAAFIDAKKTQILKAKSKAFLARHLLNWVIALAGAKGI